MSYKFLSMALAGVFAVMATAEAGPGNAPNEAACMHGACLGMSPQLNSRLNLTPEQQAQAEKIYRNSKHEMEPLMKKMRKTHHKMVKIREESLQEFEKILTPAQQKTFAQLREQERNSFERGLPPVHPGMGPKANRPHLIRGMHPTMPNTSYSCYKSKMKPTAADNINRGAGAYSDDMEDDVIIIDQGGFIEE